MIKQYQIAADEIYFFQAQFSRFNVPGDLCFPLWDKLLPPERWRTSPFPLDESNFPMRLKGLRASSDWIEIVLGETFDL
jgi:hypothetical protein